MMISSPQSTIDVQWRYNKINCFKNKITKGEPVIEISSDEGSLNEMEYHINAKELLVAKLFLKTFVKVSDAHVKLLSDNTTTVYGISNMHSNKPELCHSIIFEIWA